jgi:hypothetical protein
VVNRSLNDAPERSSANLRKETTMWSMWNAPSDLDYYGQSGFGDDEEEEDPERDPEPADYSLQAPGEEPELELEPPDDWPEPSEDGTEPPADERLGEQI